ncbi:MAG: Nif3-like dinuclear metal center hexameric protein [Polyangiaceae bacterium]|nr:Nif3-like dinuclear metal center hexameric protein [Polyangiaceae bacterium]
MAVSLTTLVDAMELLAPPSLAEPWDNVGLLLPGREGLQVTRAVVTIDLTDAVIDEALDQAADAIVSYHPILFDGKKRLRRDVASERIVLRCVERGLAVYSPHTALDSAPDGLNDWLARAAGEGTTRPLVPHPLRPEAGQGRHLDVSAPDNLENVVARARKHLGLGSLRVASAERHLRGAPIAAAAVAAGAGGPLLSKARGIDLFITGEMRHHDVLAAVEAGISVILAEHTGSERGYLPTLADRLQTTLQGTVEVVVSKRDRDPVLTVPAG